MDVLDRFQRLTVRRKLKMVEMKEEINALLVKSGRTPKYPEPAEVGEIHLIKMRTPPEFSDWS
jgi:hypothetical protein